MTTQPQWSSVDDETADLLTLVATDKFGVTPAEEWDTFVASLYRAADEHGYVRPNALRPLLRGRVAPKRIGAFVNRAKAEGLLRDTGQWETSNDAEGRNKGKPSRVYRLGRHAP